MTPGLIPALDRPFSALLFDMDGLLVDSEPLWFQVEREFARKRGFDFTAAMAYQNKGRGIPNAVRFMRELLGIELEIEAGVEELIEGVIARIDELILKPGAAELLDRARGRHGLALASSSKRRLVDATLDRFD